MTTSSTESVTPRLGRSAVVGVARSVKTRTESRSATGGAIESRVVTTIELEPATPGAEPVTVAIASPSRSGAVTRGDLVEVSGRTREDVLHARKIFNHTTGVLVESTHRRGRMSFGFFVGVIVVGILSIVVLSILNVTGVFPRRGDSPEERVRQQCYDSPHITDEQCDEVFKDGGVGRRDGVVRR